MSNASINTKICILGATGYVGGTILRRLVEHPRAATFEITLLVRDPLKEQKLSSLGLGLKVVVGSHADTTLLEALSSEADVVFAAANGDDLIAAQALLIGSKKRYQSTGIPQIFINTSGAACLLDDARGMFKGKTVYNDTNAEQLDTLDPKLPNRSADLEILKADEEGYIKSYIVVPGLVFGIAAGRFVDLGLQNPHTRLLPFMIRLLLALGEGATVGDGKNVWPCVEIHELGDLYVKLYDAIAEDQHIGHGRQGLYFATNGEFSMYDIAKETSTALAAFDKAKSAPPRPFTEEELQKYFPNDLFVRFFGGNARCVGNRSHALGWKPVKTEKDLVASVKPEVEALLRKEEK
ncbi:hypothetical protein C8J57DRAFT_1367366 [Mycena rebaudengoi]|nr:hypothetical protein C8J57DRAFT_1367366 [Mycena rebaudengoi]